MAPGGRKPPILLNYPGERTKKGGRKGHKSGGGGMKNEKGGKAGVCERKKKKKHRGPFVIAQGKETTQELKKGGEEKGQGQGGADLVLACHKGGRGVDLAALGVGGKCKKECQEATGRKGTKGQAEGPRRPGRTEEKAGP